MFQCARARRGCSMHTFRRILMATARTTNHLGLASCCFTNTRFLASTNTHTKREIPRLDEATAKQGMSLVPTQLYLKNGRIKIEVGVARGKKMYDKREA